MMKVKLGVLLVLLSFISRAQVYLPGSLDLENYYIDYLKSDSNHHIVYFPSIESKSGSGLKILDPITNVTVNSGYPRDYNNGPIWAGRGYNQSIYTGIIAESKRLKLAINPVIYFAQNASFPLAEVNPLQHPLSYQFAVDFDSLGTPTQMDWVQRFGNKSFWQIHPGQSELSFKFKSIALGVSTQNFTFGPARYNHLMMSNSGPGFPHAFIKTNNKLNLKIKDTQLGATEGFLFYGKLRESRFFDSDRSNNDRFITGLSMGYEVPYIKGLKVGFTRILYKRMDDFILSDLHAAFFTEQDTLLITVDGDSVTSGNDKFDQMASAFIEWKPANTGMRLYFEFSRNDFNSSSRRFITEFEHSRAYNLGLEKLWQYNNNSQLRVWYEHAYLNRYQSFTYRPNAQYYTHYLIRQGYTHQGQLLGAGIGPGGVSDVAGIAYYTSKRRIGLHAQRIRFNEDYFFTIVKSAEQHDVEFTISAEYMQQQNKIQWGANLAMSHRFNRYYIKLNDANNLALNVFVRLKLNQAN